MATRSIQHQTRPPASQGHVCERIVAHSTHNSWPNVQAPALDIIIGGSRLWRQHKSENTGLHFLKDSPGAGYGRCHSRCDCRGSHFCGCEPGSCWFLACRPVTAGGRIASTLRLGKIAVRLDKGEGAVKRHLFSIVRQFPLSAASSTGRCNTI
jgi:hypothetical protein